MKLTKDHIKTLAKLTLATRPKELTCDEWLDRVARLAELETSNRPIPDELDAVVDHLGVCPECCEEFDALKRVLRS